MEKIKSFLSLLRSLPGWSRIVILVAMAAAAFALTACSSALRFSRSGVRCDTVRYEGFVKSRNVVQ